MEKDKLPLVFAEYGLIILLFILVFIIPEKHMTFKQILVPIALPLGWFLIIKNPSRRDISKGIEGVFKVIVLPMYFVASIFSLRYFLFLVGLQDVVKSFDKIAVEFSKSLFAPPPGMLALYWYCILFKYYLKKPAVISELKRIEINVIQIKIPVLFFMISGVSGSIVRISQELLEKRLPEFREVYTLLFSFTEWQMFLNNILVIWLGILLIIVGLKLRRNSVGKQARKDSEINDGN